MTIFGRTFSLVGLGVRVAMALLLAFLPLSAHAQGLDLGGGDGPIEVQADEGLEWRRDERVIIARGNARASRGGDSVAADRLTAYYREVDGSEEIHRFEAEGSVEIVTGTNTFYGNSAVYEADRDSMILYGSPARAVSAEERLSATESIEFRNAERVAVARGDVRVERGDQRLRADLVTARFEENGEGALEVRRIEAEGNVLLSSPDEIVQARHAVYDVNSEVATLTGSVKITRGRNQLNGDIAEVNLETGISRLRSAPGAGGTRVRALLFPQGAESRAGGAR